MKLDLCHYFFQSGVFPTNTYDEIAAELSKKGRNSSRSQCPLHRSISSHSLPSLRIEEESLHKIEIAKAEKQKEMFETLKVRKEALENELSKRIAELKALCLKEGVSKSHACAR